MAKNISFSWLLKYEFMLLLKGCEDSLVYEFWNKLNENSIPFGKSGLKFVFEYFEWNITKDIKNEQKPYAVYDSEHFH